MAKSYHPPKPVICNTCKIEKPRSEFYRLKRRNIKKKKRINYGGNYTIHGMCKSCYSERHKRTYINKSQGTKTSPKRKRIYKPPQGRTQIEKWRKQHRVYARVKQAIEDGILAPPEVCPKCGKDRGEDCIKDRRYIHGHHEDYDKPLDVQWLCPRCHTNISLGVVT